MAHTSTTTLIVAPGETLADALTDLTKIAEIIPPKYDPRRRTHAPGVRVIRRLDRTVVSAYTSLAVEAEHFEDVTFEAVSR